MAKNRKIAMAKNRQEYRPIRGSLSMLCQIDLDTMKQRMQDAKSVPSKTYSEHGEFSRTSIVTEPKSPENERCKEDNVSKGNNKESSNHAYNLSVYRHYAKLQEISKSISFAPWKTTTSSSEVCLYKGSPGHGNKKSVTKDLNRKQKPQPVKKPADAKVKVYESNVCGERLPLWLDLKRRVRSKTDRSWVKGAKKNLSVQACSLASLTPRAGPGSLEIVASRSSQGRNLTTTEAGSWRPRAIDKRLSTRQTKRSGNCDDNRKFARQPGRSSPSRQPHKCSSSFRLSSPSVTLNDCATQTDLLPEDQEEDLISSTSNDDETDNLEVRNTSCVNNKKNRSTSQAWPSSFNPTSLSLNAAACKLLGKRLIVDDTDEDGVVRYEREDGGDGEGFCTYSWNEFERSRNQTRLTYSSRCANYSNRTSHQTDGDVRFRHLNRVQAIVRRPDVGKSFRGSTPKKAQLSWGLGALPAAERLRVNDRLMSAIYSYDADAGDSSRRNVRFLKGLKSEDPTSQTQMNNVGNGEAVGKEKEELVTYLDKDGVYGCSVISRKGSDTHSNEESIHESSCSTEGSEDHEPDGTQTPDSESTATSISGHCPVPSPQFRGRSSMSCTTFGSEKEDPYQVRTPIVNSVCYSDNEDSPECNILLEESEDKDDPVKGTEDDDVAQAQSNESECEISDMDNLSLLPMSRSEHSEDAVDCRAQYADQEQGQGWIREDEIVKPCHKSFSLTAHEDRKWPPCTPFNTPAPPELQSPHTRMARSMNDVLSEDSIYFSDNQRLYEDLTLAHCYTSQYGSISEGITQDKQSHTKRKQMNKRTSSNLVKSKCQLSARTRKTRENTVTKSVSASNHSSKPRNAVSTRSQHTQTYRQSSRRPTSPQSRQRQREPSPHPPSMVDRQHSSRLSTLMLGSPRPCESTCASQKPEGDLSSTHPELDGKAKRRLYSIEEDDARLWEPLKTVMFENMTEVPESGVVPAKHRYANPSRIRRRRQTLATSKIFEKPPEGDREDPGPGNCEGKERTSDDNEDKETIVRDVTSGAEADECLPVAIETSTDFSDAKINRSREAFLTQSSSTDFGQSQKPNLSAFKPLPPISHVSLKPSLKLNKPAIKSSQKRAHFCPNHSKLNSVNMIASLRDSSPPRPIKPNIQLDPLHEVPNTLTKTNTPPIMAPVPTPECRRVLERLDKKRLAQKTRSILPMTQRTLEPFSDPEVKDIRELPRAAGPFNGGKRCPLPLLRRNVGANRFWHPGDSFEQLELAMARANTLAYCKRAGVALPLTEELTSEQTVLTSSSSGQFLHVHNI